MSADDMEKAGINLSTQMQVAKEAITQLTAIANLSPEDENDRQLISPVAAPGGALEQVSRMYASLVQRKIVSSGKAAEYMASLNDLAPTKFWGWGPKEPPSENDFVESFMEKTGSSDDDIARILYSTFDEQYKSGQAGTPKATPADIVAFMTHKNMQSTSGRSEMVPYTPDEFASFVSGLVAGSLQGQILRDLNQRY